MKLNEVAPLNFNTQASLAAAAGEVLKDKFKFKKVSMLLYNSGGDKKNKASGLIKVHLPKRQASEAEFLGKVVSPWLRDNLASILGRGVSGVEFQGHDIDDNTIRFGFNLEV